MTCKYFFFLTMNIALVMSWFPLPNMTSNSKIMPLGFSADCGLLSALIRQTISCRSQANISFLSWAHLAKAGAFFTSLEITNTSSRRFIMRNINSYEKSFENTTIMFSKTQTLSYRSSTDFIGSRCHTARKFILSS